MTEKQRLTLAEMAANANGDTTQVRCPACGCCDFRIYKTDKAVSATFRYKSCRHCGHKILTTSKVQERIIRSIETDDDSSETMLVKFTA